MLAVRHLERTGLGDWLTDEFRVIYRLGRDISGNYGRPPIFKMEGPIFFPEKFWVLPPGGITMDESSTIRDSASGALLRQALTLHCMEYIKPGGLKVKKRKFGRNADIGGIGQPKRSGGTPANTWITKKGDTLFSIAAAVFGDAARWKEIGKPNHLTDPNRSLPAGKTLKLPL